MNINQSDACTIKLQNFEGPFDLLFFLIEKNEIDIYDIPISIITDQYMDYLFAMQKLDLDIASEFLIMASTLLHIKSRLLLPKAKNEHEEETDPREELIIKLIEYKKFKEYSESLHERFIKWSNVYYKLPEPISFCEEKEILELETPVLVECFKNVMKNYYLSKNDDTKKMNKILAHEQISLRHKIKEIINKLRECSKVYFSRIFNPKSKTKLEIATGFLAVLELVKLRKADVHQGNQFDEIVILRCNSEDNIKKDAV